MYGLFELLQQEHGIVATQGDMEAIVEVVLSNFLPDPVDTGVNRRLVQCGDHLFTFNNFNEWVNRPQALFHDHGVSSNEVICLDRKGRMLQKGQEFMRARDDESFPVMVYRVLLD